MRLAHALFILVAIALGFAGGWLWSRASTSGVPVPGPVAAPIENPSPDRDVIERLESRIRELEEALQASEGDVEIVSSEETAAPTLSEEEARFRQYRDHYLLMFTYQMPFDPSKPVESIRDLRTAEQFSRYAAGLPDGQFEQALSAFNEHRVNLAESAAGVQLPRPVVALMEELEGEAWRDYRRWVQTEFLDAVRRSTTADELYERKKEHDEYLRRMRSGYDRKITMELRKYPELRAQEATICRMIL